MRKRCGNLVTHFCSNRTAPHVAQRSRLSYCWQFWCLRKPNRISNFFLLITSLYDTFPPLAYWMTYFSRLLSFFPSVLSFQHRPHRRGVPCRGLSGMLVHSLFRTCLAHSHIEDEWKEGWPCTCESVPSPFFNISLVCLNTNFCFHL